MPMRSFFLGIDGERAMGRITHGLSFPVVRAAQFAASTQVGDNKRKLPAGESFKPDSEYEHFLRVALWLCLVKAPPEVSAAGFLHDLHEDYPEDWPLSRFRREFGSEVTKLVKIVSKPPLRRIKNSAERWKRRNEVYFEQLQAVRDKPFERWALGISCADKGANIESSIAKMTQGVPPEELMKHPWEWDVRRWIELAQLFRGHVPTAMLQEYRRLITEFWMLVTSNGLPDDSTLIHLVMSEGLHRRQS